MPESGRCLVMGVVNVTPDSFSDGGQWFDADVAIRHGLDLVAEGADIVDVGGESTRPGAARVSLEEELRRVEPVIRTLTEEGVTVRSRRWTGRVRAAAACPSPGRSAHRVAAAAGAGLVHARRTRRPGAG